MRSANAMILMALHFAPSSISNRLTASCSSRVSATAPAAAALQSWQRHALAQTARPFSSIPSRLQQAEALREETDQQELTHFEQLAQQNIISPRVISTITKKMDIHTMTDVQRMTLNHCLDGSDVIAQAKTGTGKTLAFLMPIVQRILRDPELESRRASRASTRDIRAVIISPTRELAEQIAVEAKRIVSGTSVVVQTAVGGTQKSMHLREMQRNGCHILVGTPGRILDLVSDPSTGISLENIETFVMDEADRLLDIGFAPTIADIQTYMPSRSENARQTLMFSATVPKSVVNLVRETLRPDFKFIRTIDPDESPTHDRIPQHVVFGRGLQNQIPIILEVAHNAIEAHKKDPQNNIPFKAIVYFGSKAEVQLAYETFRRMRDPEQTKSMFAPHPLDPCRIYGIHGGLNQAQRTREAAGFRVAESAILFSSDVTARGMDFPNVSHVIQIGLPKQADDYVHRIGRTGRAGKSGEGWLILNADERRDLNYKMKDSGINLKEASLVTSDLDMTRGAQIPAHIARLLKLVETGIKSVPYDTKTATYAALLGVLAQQNPSRSKQAQIDLMNDLAKFGWGMAEPPALSQRLVSKIGFGNVNGIRFENFRDTLDRAPRGEARGGMRGGDRGRNSFDRSDPFGQGASGGTGVFSNTSEGAGGDAFDTRGTSGGRSDAFGDRGDRGNRGERGFGRGGGGGGRNSAFGGDRGSSRAYGGGSGGGGFGRGGSGGRERGRY